MTDIRTVGFIGIGNMGAPMAANVKRGGFKVMAFDLDASRAKNWAQEKKKALAFSVTKVWVK